MDTLTFNFRDSDGHGAPEHIRFPILTEVDVIVHCKLALDRAATLRRGVAALGDKGIGKSLALTMALRWFDEIERLKRARDERYRVRRVLTISTERPLSYRELAIMVAKKLSRSFSDRVQARRKSDGEIVNEIVQLLAAQHYALIVVDEAETLGGAALLFLRDVMAKAEASDRARYNEEGVASAGVGVLLVGEIDDVRVVLSASTEAGHRWANVIELKPLPLDKVVEVYAAWFPGFQPHIAGIGVDAWRNYLASVVCTAGHGVFRFIDNQARTYAHSIFRSRTANQRESIPFMREAFEKAARDAGWHPRDGGKGGNPRPGRRK